MKKQSGNYYDNAQKLIKWRIDQQERVILVPKNELDQAKDNLTVQHLCNAEHRFRVGSIISESDTVGRDEMQVQWNKRVKEDDKEPEKKERIFEVLSDGSILVTVSSSATHIELAYRNWT